MNRIIRKYKNIDMQLQTSRKQVRKITIFYILILFIIIWVTILVNYNIDKTINSRLLLNMVQLILIWLVFIGFNLFIIDWSIKTQDNKLFIRRWIFKSEIPFRDLIDIIDDWWYHESFKYNFIEIKYKKGNKVKYSKMYYLWEVPFLKYEFIKKSDITEFVNIFYRDGGTIEGLKETNILLPEYKNIRTEEEEKEMDNLLNKIERKQEIGIWIILGILVAMFITFLWFIFRIK